MGTSPDEPSLDTMETIARAEFSALPKEFRDLTGDVMFVLAEEPDRQTMEELGIAHTNQLLGLFRGAPLAARLANMAGPEPTMIFLYRRPILHHAQGCRLETAQVVRHVLIHEIGHHFGLSDADMARLDAE